MLLVAAVVLIVLAVLLVAAVVLVIAVKLLVVVAIEAHLLTSLFIIGIVCLILRKAIHVKTQGRIQRDAADTKRTFIYHGNGISHQGGYTAQRREDRKDSAANKAGRIHGSIGCGGI